MGAATWTGSNGNFWLFGGYGEDAVGDPVLLNDLWEFNPSTNLWAWMGGTQIVNVLSGWTAGVYGTEGVPAAGNIPGSRTGASAWTDTSGNFWLLGGNAGGAGGYFNDLWKYNPVTNQWAWMNGAMNGYCPVDPSTGFADCSSQPAVLGTLGMPAAGNTPGGGSGSAAWTDHNGNFWLFGAGYTDSLGQEQGFDANTLWVFNPTINQWAWMGGDYEESNCSYIILVPFLSIMCDGSQGVFGVPGTPALGNTPAARSGAASWTDKSGNFWLFGGSITNLSNAPGYRNDLWEFQPSASTLPAAPAPVFSLKGGIYTSGGPLTISNGMANAKIYYTTDGTSPTILSTPYSGAINISSTVTINAIAVAPGYRNSGVGSATYTFPPPPPAPTFSVAPGTYTSTLALTISDTTPGVTIYYTTDGTNPVSTNNVTRYTGPIAISSSETINAVAAVTDGYFVLNGIAADYGPSVVSGDASAAYTINLPQAATPIFSLRAGTYTSTQTVTISEATAGATIYYTTDGTMPTANSSVYSGPITVSATETIEAIATAANYMNSAVASATYTINTSPANFTLAASPTSLTASSGGQVTTTLTVTPQNGFNSAVSFACSGLLTGTTCSFNPASVTPAGSSATTTLTISASSQAKLEQPKNTPWLPVTALAAGVFLFFRKGHALPIAILVVIAFLGLGAMSACGGGAAVNSGSGGGGSGSSTPEQSTVTVTATSGALQQTVTILLTVN